MAEQGVASGEASPEAEQAASPRLRALKGLALAVVLGGLSVAIATWAEPRTGTVATVDGQKIAKADYHRMLGQARSQYQARYQVPPDSPSGSQIEADLRVGVVRELVQRELVRQEAEKRGIQLADREVEAEMTRIRQGFKDEAEFQKLLSDQGADEAALVEQVRSGMRAARLSEALATATPITPAEVRAYYDQHEAMYRRPEEVRARHILVKQADLARTLQGKLRAGEPFDALAKAHSEDTGSRANGGDLGFFPRGQMVPPFEQAAFSLPLGQVSEPVKSDFGYHLIRVEARHPARKLPFEEVREEITTRLTRERRDTVFRAWLEQRRESAHITYGAGFAPPSPAGHVGHEGEGH